jgi:hypothetical protein
LEENFEAFTISQNLFKPTQLKIIIFALIFLFAKWNNKTAKITNSKIKAGDSTSAKTIKNIEMHKLVF